MENIIRRLRKLKKEGTSLDLSGDGHIASIFYSRHSGRYFFRFNGVTLFSLKTEKAFAIRLIEKMEEYNLRFLGGD